MRPSPTYLLNVTAYSALCLRAVFSPNSFSIVSNIVPVPDESVKLPAARPRAAALLIPSPPAVVVTAMVTLMEAVEMVVAVALRSKVVGDLH